MLLSILGLTLLFYNVAATGLNLNALRQEALTLHNRYRQMHCVTPMVLNQTLNTLAQELADYAAATNIFIRPTPLPIGIGQTLQFTWTSNPFAVKGKRDPKFSV